MSNAMYYIALVAPEAINDKVIQWKHFMRDRFGCIVALKSPAHITLISPFWMNTDMQSGLENAIKEFSNTRNRFLIELKNFDCFKPRVIFVHVKESDSLSSLETEFNEYLVMNILFPIKNKTKPFHPHLTIANRDLHKKDFTEAWQYFKNKTYKASFLASGITLLRHNGIRWDSAYIAAFPFT
jgi:2'-5' RNA ligase